MGDRANIALHYGADKGVIYLYSHWDGADMAVIAKRALRRGKDRWGDPPYLSRILFSEMVKGHLMDDTGYGISPYITDNSYNHVEVYLEEDTVRIDGKKWSFEQYIEEDDKVLKKAMSGWSEDKDEDEESEED